MLPLFKGGVVFFFSCLILALPVGPCTSRRNQNLKENRNKYPNMIVPTKSRNKIPEPPRNRRSNGRKVSIAITGHAISSDVTGVVQLLPPPKQQFVPLLPLPMPPPMEQLVPPLLPPMKRVVPPLPPLTERVVPPLPQTTERVVPPLPLPVSATPM